MAPRTAQRKQDGDWAARVVSTAITAALALAAWALFSVHGLEVTQGRQEKDAQYLRQRMDRQDRKLDRIEEKLDRLFENRAKGSGP